MLQLLRRLMVPGDPVHRRLANSHRILESVHRDKVTVTCVQVILLRTGQRSQRIGNLCGRGRTLKGFAPYEPLVLTRLVNGWACIGDAEPGCDGIPVGLVDLERDLVGNRLCLGHGLTDARVSHAGRGDPPTTLKERPLETYERETQIGMTLLFLLLEIQQR